MKLNRGILKKFIVLFFLNIIFSLLILMFDYPIWIIVLIFESIFSTGSVFYLLWQISLIFLSAKKRAKLFFIIPILNLILIITQYKKILINFPPMPINISQIWLFSLIIVLTWIAFDVSLRNFIHNSIKSKSIIIFLLNIVNLTIILLIPFNNMFKCSLSISLVFIGFYLLLHYLAVKFGNMLRLYFNVLKYIILLIFFSCSSNLNYIESSPPYKQINVNRFHYVPRLKYESGSTKERILTLRPIDGVKESKKLYINFWTTVFFKRDFVTIEKMIAPNIMIIDKGSERIIDRFSFYNYWKTIWTNLDKMFVGSGKKINEIITLEEIQKGIKVKTFSQLSGIINKQFLTPGGYLVEADIPNIFNNYKLLSYSRNNNFSQNTALKLYFVKKRDGWILELISL